MANHKSALSVDDIEFVKRIIRSEMKDLVDAVDETSIANLKRIGQVTDRNSYNILKLQAQVTALKEVLIGKGAVGRQNLQEREERELGRLEAQVKALENPEAATGAMPH